MSLSSTPTSERIRIGFFGRTNTGKSSLINALTASDISLVSDIPGTTTDPVSKTMELLPIGPVVLVDTPGLSDESALGSAREKRTRLELSRCDIAILVTEPAHYRNGELSGADQGILDKINALSLPCIIVCSKADLSDETPLPPAIPASAKENTGIEEIKKALGELYLKELKKEEEKRLIGDLIAPGDTVVLVCPIDDSAPKGRLILPQVLAIRDILDNGAIAVVTKETELSDALTKLHNPPKLVITDSQVFKKVDAIVPENIPLTSFSILMARYKGFLDTAIKGINAIDCLKDGDTVLMAEGCTHHRQCGDIGTVKLPNWLRKYTGKNIKIETCSGHDFPEDLKKYSLIIHCGGCMISEKEVIVRMKQSETEGTAFTNYGIVIAKMNGILERALAPLLKT